MTVAGLSEYALTFLDWFATQPGFKAAEGGAGFHR
jgi:hypothetical protein